MTESDEEIQIIDESEQQAVAAAHPIEPFDSEVYVSKLIEFMESTENNAPERLKYFVAQTWARPADSTCFYSDSYPLDAGGVSKLPTNMMMPGAKRIAGTQRLMYVPSPIMKKSTSESSVAGSAPGVPPKKVKRQMPVIDDSIYCSTDQPCIACGGVSQSGNQVLVCKRCKDCFHMRCSQPTVSVEEASDPKFVYHCKTCLVSKKVIDGQGGSRSRVPSFSTEDEKP
ncbi:unnamed protein product [Caenorhabditis sp. 36 PRJEB53466]|nr:unnamed protein product [Caenorhabditis sp. 36 PRJEB53466]